MPRRARLAREVMRVRFEELLKAGCQLSEPVMDLVGQTPPFILLRHHQLVDQPVERALAVGDLAIEADVFERRGRLEGDAAQDLQRRLVSRARLADRLQDADYVALHDERNTPARALDVVETWVTHLDDVRLTRRQGLRPRL